MDLKWAPHTPLQQPASQLLHAAVRGWRHLRERTVFYNERRLLRHCRPRSYLLRWMKYTRVNKRVETYRQIVPLVYMDIVLKKCYVWLLLPPPPQPPPLWLLLLLITTTTTTNLLIVSPRNCTLLTFYRPRVLGDGHWPQVWDFPKIPPRGRRGIKSRTRRTFTGYPTAKSTYRLNFLWIVVWPGGRGF